MCGSIYFKFKFYGLQFAEIVPKSFYHSHSQPNTAIWLEILNFILATTVGLKKNASFSAILINLIELSILILFIKLIYYSLQNIDAFTVFLMSNSKLLADF